MKIHLRSHRATVVLLLVLPVLWFCLLAASASAQEAAPAQPDVPPTADLESLLGTLENEQERQRLIENLRALVEVQQAEEAAEEDHLGSRLMGEVSGAVGELSSELADAAIELQVEVRHRVPAHHHGAGYGDGLGLFTTHGGYAVSNTAPGGL